MRSENFSELSDFAHCPRGRYRNIEILKTFLALLNHVFHPDIICTCIARCLRSCALGENKHAHLFSTAMGQWAGPAHHLIRLLRVDSKPERKRHRLIEFRR